VTMCIITYLFNYLHFIFIFLTVVILFLFLLFQVSNSVDQTYTFIVYYIYENKNYFIYFIFYLKKKSFYLIQFYYSIIYFKENRGKMSIYPLYCGSRT